MCPVKALAATVAGEARNTCDSRWPIRPGKFRLVALMHLRGAFIHRRYQPARPGQAAHPAFSVICTPASSAAPATPSFHPNGRIAQVVDDVSEAKRERQRCR